MRTSGGWWRRVAALWMAAGVLAAVTVPIVAAPALACSCAGLGEAELLDNADVAFTGRVESVTAPRSEFLGLGFGGDSVTAMLAVARVYKGELPANVEVMTAMDGAACGFHFEADRDYAVFAAVGGNGTVDAGPDELTATLCNGTRLLDDAPLDLGPGSAPLSSGDGVGAAKGLSGPGDTAYGVASWSALLSVGALTGWLSVLWLRLTRRLKTA